MRLLIHWGLYSANVWLEFCHTWRIYHWVKILYIRLGSDFNWFNFFSIWTRISGNVFSFGTFFVRIVLVIVVAKKLSCIDTILYWHYDVFYHWSNNLVYFGLFIYILMLDCKLFKDLHFCSFSMFSCFFLRSFWKFL